MDRPKILAAEALGRIPLDIKNELDRMTQAQGGKLVYVIAFRGYYQDTMGKPGVNDRGIYDDCMCVVFGDYYGTFNGNTDPSRYKPEVATLIPGLHRYKQGKHGITTHADGGYAAFRPATPDESLPVWRDGEGTKVFKGIAINLHKGGFTTTSSEGCQTIHPDQWDDFQPRIYYLMNDNKQVVLPYVLIDWKQ